MQFNHNLKNVKIYEAGKPIELVVREFGIGKDEVIKLASNENPYGLSPKVANAIKEEATKVNLYPDDSMYELKEALCIKYSVKESQIIIGAGSDQVIDLAIKSKCEEGAKLLMARTTFAMYEIYAKQIGANIIKTDSHTHDLEQFLALYQSNKDIDMIFLCLPNNPLGESLDTKAVYEFLSQVSPDTLVVVDGAYQEYASYKDPNKAIDPADLIERFPNAIYLGTFSKAYGLGGMRVGYGIAQEDIMQNLYKLRPPFNITTLSLKAAIEATKDDDFVKESVKKNFEQMRRYEEFIEQNGYGFIPSYTNFITFVFDDSIDAKDVADRLLRRGIIVRSLAAYGMNSIRVTIGTKEQNDRFFEEFKKLGL
jgi:histidinol-phosphate aminotransferase